MVRSTEEGRVYGETRPGAIKGLGPRSLQLVQTREMRLAPPSFGRRGSTGPHLDVGDRARIRVGACASQLRS